MPLEVAHEPEISSAVRQMNKMMDQLQKGFFNFRAAETWTPAVNLYENDSSYLVCVDLSGVIKDKIDLIVADGRLKLRGQRSVPVMPDGPEGETRSTRLRVHLMEIDHGPFSREVDLPNDVAHDRIVANYVNGMLWIELPKR